MSDWDIVKQFVINNGYQPKYTDLDGVITVILLSWDGVNEESNEPWELEDFLHDMVAGDLQSYDYE